MTDEQIKELAEKHGWFGVEAWWSMAIPRFRAMLEERTAQQSFAPDVCHSTADGRHLFQNDSGVSPVAYAGKNNR